MLGQPVGIPDPATSDEVTEGRPWWKVCCIGCCLGFLVIVAALFFTVHSLSGPGPKPVKNLPTTYPRALAFRPEESSQILYYSGSSKGSISRLITAPLNWVSGLTRGTSASSTGIAAAMNAKFGQLQRRDTVTISWSNLDASREEIMRFYTGALQEVGVYGVKSTDPNGTTEVHLSGENANVTFDLLIEDDPEKAGIDTLTVRTDYVVPDAPTQR